MFAADTAQPETTWPPIACSAAEGGVWGEIEDCPEGVGSTDQDSRVGSSTFSLETYRAGRSIGEGEGGQEADQRRAAGEVLCKADPQIRIPMSCYGSFESLETDGLFAASPAGVRMAAALIKEFSKKDPEFPKKVETFVSTGLEIARGWWLGSLSS